MKTDMSFSPTTITNNDDGINTRAKSVLTTYALKLCELRYTNHCGLTTSFTALNFVNLMRNLSLCLR